MKNSKLRVSLVVLSFVLVVLLFSSSQPYERQSLTHLINNVLHNHPGSTFLSGINFDYGGKVISIKALGYNKFIEFFVRKFAHFSIFLIIGYLVQFIFVNYRIVNKFTPLLSWFTIISLAFLDESHQLITPHRTPLFQDVWLDALGGLFGILICFFIQKLKIKR